MTDFVVVIPARYGSSRLPGKPLLDIAGKPMIQRVYEQAQQSSASRIVVATDDDRIVDAVKQFGGEVCLTRADHPSGTDRLQEVAQHYQWAEDAIIVNVQGDEPMIPPTVINQVADNLAGHSQAGIATLCEAISDIESFLNPNAVKVVFNDAGYALYFSRAPIPWPRDAFQKDQTQWPAGLRAFRHIGIYAYRGHFLNQYVALPPALLEQTESLEQLRAMAAGVKIHVAEAIAPVPAGVDTEQDWHAVQARFAEN